jgi:hypothetical protein
MDKNLIEFIQDNDVIKERLKHLIFKLKISKANHLHSELVFFKQHLEPWCLSSYVRIKYLLGEPL